MKYEYMLQVPLPLVRLIENIKRSRCCSKPLKIKMVSGKKHNKQPTELNDSTAERLQCPRLLGRQSFDQDTSSERTAHTVDESLHIRGTVRARLVYHHQTLTQGVFP